MANAIADGEGIRILRQDYYEILISFIISQNNNIPRIKKCVESMCEAYGEPLGEYGGRMRYAFPAPERIAQTSPDEFTAMKFGYRSEYMPLTSKRYLSEGIPTGDAPQQRATLLGYKGIGPKVANCIMLFGLRGMQAFPIDTWIKKYMCEVYGFPESDVKGMQAFAEARFGEYGGMAQQYIFYSARG